MTPAELAAPGALSRRTPPADSNPSGNFRSLFEIPVIVHTLSIRLFIARQVDAAQLAARAALHLMHSS